MMELSPISVGEAVKVPGVTVEFAERSQPILQLAQDGEVLGVVGFIPHGPGAYVWMAKTPLAMEHPTVFARYARRVIQDHLRQFNPIVGHSDLDSWRWLDFLGAETRTIFSDLVEFTIRG